MRGPGASTYSDEVEVAERLDDLFDQMDAAGVTIKLGHIPDDQRSNLTVSMATLMKRHHLDALRVLLAKQMVAEAQEIARKWLFPDHRNASAGRRYGDLLFSARAILPPGYDWDKVTYTGPEGKRCWSHQLSFDRNGLQIEGVRYDADDAEQLLGERKGEQRVLPTVEEMDAAEAAG